MLLLGCFFALVLGTSWVPYLFPPQDLIEGVSFDVGFNNSVAFYWYLATLAAAAIILAFALPKRVGELFASPGATRWSPLARIAALVVCGHALLFSLLYAYKGRFVFSEGLFFQSLLHRMTMGEVPYVDFTYYYGPAMIYPAYWLTGVLPLEAAYAIWFVATYLLGLVILAVVLARLLGPRPATPWFALLAIGLFNPLTGVNFTLTRYLLPTLVFLIVFPSLRHAGVGRLLIGAAVLAIALLYSPDAAVLSLLAVATPVALAVASRALERIVPSHPVPALRGGSSAAVARASGMLVLGTAAAVAAFLLIDAQGRALSAYPAGATERLAGAHNLPIYPNLPFVALAALSVFGVASTLRLLTLQASDLSRMAVAYLPLAIASQRPSFGTSDPQHIVFFGLPTLLLSLVVSRWSPAGRAVRMAIALVATLAFVIPQQLYYVSQILPSLARVLPSAAVGVTTSAPGGATTAAIESTLIHLVEELGRDRPYLMHRLTYYSIPVYHRLGLRYAGPDTDADSVTTREQVSRLISDLREKNAYVLIQRTELEERQRPFTPSPFWNALALVTGAPMPGSDLVGRMATSNARLLLPFYEFLETEYRPVRELNGIVALERRPP